MLDLFKKKVEQDLKDIDEILERQEQNLSDFEKLVNQFKEQIKVKEAV